MRSAKLYGIIIATAVLIGLTACRDIGQNPPEETIEGKFEIIWDKYSGLSPDLYAINALKAKFPHAEFHYTAFESPDYTQFYVNPPLSIYDVAEKGLYGDLIMIESTLAPYLFKTGYLEPLDHELGTSLMASERLNPELLDRVREQGDGEIYGIPFGKNAYALYYNAGIFNELNLPVPTDGMTWDAVFELARHITEHPLRGNRAALRVADENLAYSQFHLRVFDPETGQPDIESPLWERRREWSNQLAELVDRNLEPLDYDAYSPFSSGQLAMIAGRYLGLSDIGISNRGAHGLSAPMGKDWDMVSFPVFADAPDTGPAPAYYYLGIPKNSQHKREAFQMISYLLSDGPQMENSRNGLRSILNNPDIDSRFGELTLMLPGKHVQAFFQHTKEGTYDPEYDWDLQYAGKWIYEGEGEGIEAIREFHRKKLEKAGITADP